MASSITSIVKTAPYHWKYTWSGTSPYYVYKDGRLMWNPFTTRTYWVFESSDDKEPPIIEVRDSTEAETTIQQMVNPPYGILQWRGTSNADHYVIQKQVASGAGYVWTTVPPGVKERSEGYYRYNTPVLADQTTHTWRVVAVDKAGTYTPIEFQFLIVRNPDAPVINVTYSGGNLTVSERT